MPAALQATIREPVQRRSRQALARIFAAAGELLAEKDFDQISVGEVAAAADVSVGSIYQRFKSKDALLWALYQNYLGEAEAAFDTLTGAAPFDGFEERISFLIRTVTELFKSRRGIVRSLLHRNRYSPSDIPQSFITRINAVYASGVRYLAGAASLRNGDARIQFAFSLIVTACREEFILGDSSGFIVREKSEKAFEKMLVDAVAGVVKGREKHNA